MKNDKQNKKALYIVMGIILGVACGSLFMILTPFLKGNEFMHLIAFIVCLGVFMIAKDKLAIQKIGYDSFIIAWIISLSTGIVLF